MKPDRRFFERHPRVVARQMLGALLIREDAAGKRAGRIVETEAYLGTTDAAAHAAAGQTARNAVLFGPAGHAYVYFTYGMHYCMNVSCEPPGRAGCVLIRALEPVLGIAAMAAARGRAPEEDPRAIAAGPARLCQALGITRPRDNGKDLLSPDSDLRLELTAERVGKITSGVRIGIRKAAELELRFWVAGNRFVSRG